MASNEGLIAQFEPQTIRSGNYELQRQLDFRVVRGQSLRIISPGQHGRSVEKQRNEQDFQIAMRRRRERVGMTLNEMGKKHGL